MPLWSPDQHRHRPGEPEPVGGVGDPADLLGGVQHDPADPRAQRGAATCRSRRVHMAVLLEDYEPGNAHKTYAPGL